MGKRPPLDQVTYHPGMGGVTWESRDTWTSGGGGGGGGGVCSWPAIPGYSCNGGSYLGCKTCEYMDMSQRLWERGTYLLSRYLNLVDQ